MVASEERKILKGNSGRGPLNQKKESSDMMGTRQTIRLRLQGLSKKFQNIGLRKERPEESRLGVFSRCIEIREVGEEAATIKRAKGRGGVSIWQTRPQGPDQRTEE